MTASERESAREWTTERQPGDDEECERLGCEDRTHPVHHRFLLAPTPSPDAGEPLRARVEMLGRTGLRAAIALIAADWFDTGYENGRLDHGVLADRLFAALRSLLADEGAALLDEAPAGGGEPEATHG